MMSSGDADNDREAYEPPTIEDVPLTMEEQLLAGCKTTTGPSPGRSGKFKCAPCKHVSAS